MHRSFGKASEGGSWTPIDRIFNGMCRLANDNEYSEVNTLQESESDSPIEFTEPDQEKIFKVLRKIRGAGTNEERAWAPPDLPKKREALESYRRNRDSFYRSEEKLQEAAQGDAMSKVPTIAKGTEKRKSARERNVLLMRLLKEAEEKDKKKEKELAQKTELSIPSSLGSEGRRKANRTRLPGEAIVDLQMVVKKLNEISDYPIYPDGIPVVPNIRGSMWVATKIRPTLELSTNYPWHLK